MKNTLGGSCTFSRHAAEAQRGSGPPLVRSRHREDLAAYSKMNKKPNAGSTPVVTQLNLVTGGRTLRSGVKGSWISEAGSLEKIALAKPKRYID
jgi:hypothetical protein